VGHTRVPFRPRCGARRRRHQARPPPLTDDPDRDTPSRVRGDRPDAAARVRWLRALGGPTADEDKFDSEFKSCRKRK
jgi:hypothetical protein